MLSSTTRVGLTALSSSLLSSCFAKGEHTLPDLPYGYRALEPVISDEIMEIHHQKHHATYVNNLNAAESQLQEYCTSGDVKGYLGLQSVLKFNGGGHLNHSLFWNNLSPVGGGLPEEGPLLEAIDNEFGSFDNFRQKMTAQTMAIQGSGWGWLGYNTVMKRLEIATTSNQDPLQATTGLVPLLGIDVWEHAYYLQYKSVRPDYIKAIWDIVYWRDVSENFWAACSNNPTSNQCQ